MLKVAVLVTSQAPVFQVSKSGSAADATPATMIAAAKATKMIRRNLYSVADPENQDAIFTDLGGPAVDAAQ